MSNPLVCAVMLTQQARSRIGRLAAESYAVQSYDPKRLVFVDGDTGESIGRLRNRGASYCANGSIIATWDDDDWSHPLRIEEQVALLESTGADCVGYHDLLFWHTDRGEAYIYTSTFPGLFAGTTLCYWRRTWEAQQFADLPRATGGTSEDAQWLRELRQRRMKVASVSSLTEEPRMIARIHGTNHGAAHYDRLIKSQHNFQRAPEWDAYCAASTASA